MFHSDKYSTGSYTQMFGSWLASSYSERCKLKHEAINLFQNYADRKRCCAQFQKISVSHNASTFLSFLSIIWHPISNWMCRWHTHPICDACRPGLCHVVQLENKFCSQCTLSPFTKPFAKC